MPTQQDYYAYLRSQATSPATFKKSTHTAGSSDPNAFNPGQFLIDLLSTGGYATAGIAKKIGENVSSIQKGDMGGLLDIANPLSILGGAGSGIANRQTYSPLLQNLGMDKNVSPWVGLLLDIGLDPTTYLTLGSVAAVKGISGGVKAANLINKGVKGAEGAIEAGKIMAKGTRTGEAAAKFGDIVTPIGRELTQSEKLGNLLTGAYRGYTGEKAAIRQAHFGSKLERKAIKEAGKAGETVVEGTIKYEPLIARGASAGANDAAYRGLLTGQNALKGIIEQSTRLTRLSNKVNKESIKAVERSMVKPKDVAKAAKVAEKAAGNAATDLAKATTTTGQETGISAQVFTDALATDVKASRALELVSAKFAKLDQLARQIENPAAHGGANYIADLKPAIYDANMPYDPVNLVPHAKPVEGGFLASATSKMLKYKKLQDFGKTVYKTEAEALSAAKNAVDSKLAEPLAKFESDVISRIDEAIAYEDAVAIAEALKPFGRLSIETMLKSARKMISSTATITAKDAEIFNAVKDIVISLPDAPEYDGLRVLIGQLQADEAAKVLGSSYSPEDIQAWADFVNKLPGVQRQIENNRKGIKSVRWFQDGTYNAFHEIYQTDLLEPNDFWQVGNLTHEMSIAEKTNGLKKMEQVKAEASPAALEEKQIKPKSDAAVIKTSFEDRVQKLPKTKKAEFLKARTEWQRLNREIANVRVTSTMGQEVSDLKKAQAVQRAIMDKLMPEIRTEIAPQLKPGEVIPVKIERVAPVKRTGTTKRRLARSMQNRKATDATIEDILLFTGSASVGEIKTLADNLFETTMRSLPRSAKDVTPLEKVSLLDRVFPKTAEKDNQIFAQFRRYLGGKLNADQIDDPQFLKEAFQEFLSGRNIEAAKINGVIDMEKLIAPDMGGFTGLADLIDALKNNKVELTQQQITKITKLVGISDDPTTVKSERIIRALVNVSNRYEKAFKAKAETQAELDLAQSDRNFIETQGEAATIDNAIGAAGIPATPEVALAVETATQATEEINKIVEDVITGTKTAATPDELTARLLEIQAVAVKEFSDDIKALDAMGGSTTSFIQVIVNDLLTGSAKYPGLVDNLKKISATRGISPEKLLEEAITKGEVSIREFPDDFFSGKVIRIDGINIEARFNANSRAFDRTRAVKGSKNVTDATRKLPENLVKEEATLLSATGNFFRSIGIPVTSRENYGQQLLRLGVETTDEALPIGAVELQSLVTYADIAKVMIEKGDATLLSRARLPKIVAGKTPQNIMPNQFENAWLVILDALTRGEKVISGDETWLRAKEAFNTRYVAGTKAGVKKQPVANLFKPALHITGTKNNPAGKDVNAAIDEIINSITKHAEDILTIHSGRAATTTGVATLAEIKRSSGIYAAIAKLGLLRSEFLKNAQTLSTKTVDTALGRQEALLVGTEGMIGFDRLVIELKPILEEINKLNISDAQISGPLFDTLISSLLRGVTKSDKLDTRARSMVVRLIDEAATDAQRTLRFDGVYPKGKKPAAKATKAETAQIRKERQARTAKNMQESAGAAEAAEPVRAAEIAKQEQDIAAGAKGDFETSVSSTNLVVGHEDPYIAMLEMAANSAFKTRIGDAWMSRFSGVFGMGKETKTVVGGVEHLDIGLIGSFRSGLQQIAKRFNNDMESINNAFGLMQRWGAEMRDLDLEGQSLTDFAEWVKTADTTGVNMDIVKTLQPWHEEIFGSLDGKQAGALSKAMELSTYRSELNKFIGRQGLAQVNKDGAGFILRKMGEESGDNAHPLDVRWLWTKVNIADMENTNALDFLARFSSALHMTHTRLAAVESFTYLFGRNLKQIREEGLNASNFFKPDPEEIKGIGHLIPEDTYFEPKEFERLMYLNKYLEADSGFGTASLQRLVDISDRVTHVLKATQTLWRPGHHVTSVVGEAFMNMIHGVTKPAYYSKAYELMRAYSHGSVDDTENVFRAYAELNAGKGMVINANEFDTIYYIGNDGKRHVVPQKAIWVEMERHGVATNPFQSKEDFINTDGSAFGKGIVKTISRQNDKLATFSSHRDNIFRIAHFLKELETGGKYADLSTAALYAARKVHEAHPTVGSMSAFEKKYMRRVVYFYTWQRLVATHIAALMIEKPGIVTIPSKIQYAFAESAGFNPASFGDPWDPDGVYASYNSGSVYGPQFSGPQGKMDAWGLQPAVPQLDIINSLFQGFTVQPNQSPMQAFGNGMLNLATKNFSPIPKMFAEISTQQKVGTTGTPIAPQGNYLPYILDQIGGVATLSQITGIGRDPITNKTQQNFDEERIRKIANWLTGQKITDYSTPTSQKQWTQDQRDTITRLIKQQNPTVQTIKY